MKKLLFTFLSLLLLGAFAPMQSYACGTGCKKETTPTADKAKKEKSCCTKDNKAQDCCKKNTPGQRSGDQDCGGKCGGKCGSNCNCTAAHFAAITTEVLDLFLFQPDFSHQDFPCITPLKSNRSLDIWLPPDIRA